MAYWGYHLILDCKSGNLNKVKSKDNIKKFVQELVAEIDRIVVNTKFSDVPLLDGTFNMSGASGRDIIPVSLGEFATSTVGR